MEGHKIRPKEVFEIIKNKGLFKKVTAFVVLCAVLAGSSFSVLAAYTNTQSDRFALSYVYFGTTAQQIENVTLAGNTLSAVSPCYFELNSDGSLKLGTISADFIAAAKAKGIKVIPFLSNHWDRNVGIAALNNIDSLAKGIVSAINTYNLDGINIDLENLTPTERQKYVQLVAAIKAALPSGKTVSVAVAANPYYTDKGWQGSYDYSELAKYADFLFIMAYDEHYNGGTEGPVASISFVEKSIQYALKYVSKDKLVLGIPFYGRIWSQDGKVKGVGVSLVKIAEIMANYQYTVTYDDASKSAKLEFTINYDDATFNTGSKILTAGTYTVWYENSDSIKEKLALAAKYDLKGAGNWSAGQETKDVWTYYETWLNGKYFEDISHCFAKDDIQSLAGQGIIQGIAQYQFGPGQSLTRGEAAAILVRALGLDTSNVTTTTYSDTKNHWAKNYIEVATKAGLLTGYEDKSFMPDAKISRAEMAAIISRMLKISSSTNTAVSFSDIDPSYWAYNNIATLTTRGIISGYTDGTFKPFSQITRAEAAALINRAMGTI